MSASSPAPRFGEASCTSCDLCRTATTVCVQGRGTPKPDILIVGEAPGHTEDREGRAFVGAAGAELEKLLKEAKVDLKRVRVSNVVRCIPMDPSGDLRPPTPEEVAACIPYLRAEIDALRPKVIVPVGNVALLALLGLKTITKVRGRKFDYQQGTSTGETITIPAVPTYHPAYLLRQYSERRSAEAITDFSHAAQIARGEEHTWEKKDYRIIATEHELRTHVDWLVAHKPRIAYDVETSNDAGFGTGDAPSAFDPTSRIVTVQISHAKDQAVLIPVAHPGGSFHTAVGRRVVAAELRRLFASGLEVAGQYVKYDCAHTAEYLGVTNLNVVYDTGLMHHVLHGGERPNNLEYLEATYLRVTGHKQMLQDEVAQIAAVRRERAKETGEEPKPVYLEEISLDRLLLYACGDADHTLQLSFILQEILRGRYADYDRSKKSRGPSLLDVYHQQQMGPWRTILDMERAGVHIDVPYLESIRPKFEGKLAAVVQAISETPAWGDALETLVKPNPKRRRKVRTKKADQVDGAPDPKPEYTIVDTEPEYIYPELNLNSTAHKRALLYDALHVPFAKQLNAAAKSDETTEKKVLASALAWAQQNDREDAVEVLTLLLEHSKWFTEWKNYLRPGKLDSFIFDAGRSTVHPSFNNDGTVSGRLSASRPAIHSAGRKSHTKRCVTSRFAEDGRRGFILSADASQIEFRVAAALSRDRGLLQAYSDRLDVHRYVASLVFRIPMEQVTDDQRHLAKTVGFGVIYGRTAHGISTGIPGITEDYAESIIQKFFREFPGMKDYIDSVIDFARRNEFTRSVLGRIRPLPDINSEDNRLRQHSENQAVNFTIQSPAADIGLSWARLVHDELVLTGARTLLCGTVHDSCVLDVYPTEVMSVLRMVRSKMLDENAKLFPWFTVPMEMEMEIGTSWGGVVPVSVEGDDLVLRGNPEDTVRVYEQLDFDGSLEVSEWAEHVNEAKKTILTVRCRPLAMSV